MNKQLILTTILFFLSIPLFASHIVGGETNYKCLGNNQYEVTFILYRDCGAISAPNTLSVTLDAPNCGASAPNETLTLVSLLGTEVTPICSSVSSSCSGGTIYGIERYEYQGTITLPSACDSWQIGWTTCCRSPSVTNGNASSTYLEVSINNSQGSCSNSPEFSSSSIPYACSNQPFNFSFSTIDIDGDIPSYELISPMETDPNTFYSFAAGYSASQPVRTSPSNSLIFNNQTGELSCTPDGQQYSVMAVRVYDIRNGDTLGHVMKDIPLFSFNNCTNASPIIDSVVLGPNTGFDPLTNSFSACGCDTLNFTIQASDLNGATDSLSIDLINTNLNQVFGSGNVNMTISYPNPVELDSAEVNVAINTCNLATNAYTASIVLTDSKCPIPLAGIFSFSLLIDQVTASANKASVCAGSTEDIQLNASSPAVGTFSWQQISGPTASFNNTNIANPVLNLAPNSNIGDSILLEVDFQSAGCNTKDSVILYFDSLSYTIEIDASENILCPNGDTSIIVLNSTLSTISDSASFTYNWIQGPTTASVSLNANNISSPTLTITGGLADSASYYLHANNGICEARDTISINYRDFELTASSSLDTICPGDSILLSANISSSLITFTPNCGIATAYTCSANSIQDSVGSVTGTTDMPFDGFWEDGKTQMLFRAAELHAAGLQAGLINELSMIVDSKSSSLPYNNFEIRIGCTNLNEFTSTTFINNLLLVYSGTHSTFVGLNSFVLDSIYAWDGVSNLIVQFCFDNTTWTNGDNVLSTTTPYNSVLDFSSDGVSGCTETMANFAIDNRPIVYFSICPGSPAYNLNWTPNYAIADNRSDSTLAWPSATTTYITEASEGNCVERDSVLITVIPANLPAPIFTSCDSVFNSPSVQFSWESLPNITGWEYSVDSGTSFISLSPQDTSLSLNIGHGNCVELQLRAVDLNDPQCSRGPLSMLTCCTPEYCSDSSIVRGRVVLDTSGNCIIDSTELFSLVGTILEFNDGTESFYTNVYDTTGAFELEIDSATYSIQALPPNPYWQLCNSSQVDIDTICNEYDLDLALTPIINCPFFEVDLSVPVLRSTLSSNYVISYCNYGTVASPANTQLVVEIDSFLNILGTSISPSSSNQNTLSFNIGSIAVGACGQIYIDVIVDPSTSFVGQTHCSEAYIPTNLCVPGLWTGAVMEVDANCQQDSIEFIIGNTGTAMTSPLNYYIYEDSSLIHSNSFSLLASQDTSIIQFATAGKTYRIIVEQEAGYPSLLGDSTATVFVENCNLASNQSNISQGFGLQFSNGNSAPYIAVGCEENIAAYDPNIKSAQPVGYTDAHYISATDYFDYKVQFQNTGNDSAVNIVVLDTLSPHLDWSSIQLLSSSHPLIWKLNAGGILDVSFENIMLPDSMTNPVTSIGFFKFRIAQKANNPIGTIINNSASIYFDFSAPIMTNTTYHEIGSFPHDSGTNTAVNSTLSRAIQVNVFPNPARDYINFELVGYTGKGIEFQVYDLQGRLIHTKRENSSFIHLDRASSWNTGLYFYRILDQDQRALSTGKFIWN